MAKDEKEISIEAAMKLLAEEMPREAIQKTEKAQTKKGYDTTGIGYQYTVNRLNDVFGDEWGFSWAELNHATGTFGTGKPFHEITVSVSIWVLDKNNPRTCVGGHISSTYADALKGAITNGFKKTAAFWGVGKQAYEGTLDDDTAYPEHLDSAKHDPPPKESPEKTKPASSGQQDTILTGIDKVTVSNEWFIIHAGEKYYTTNRTIAEQAKTISQAGLFANITYREEGGRRIVYKLAPNEG